MALKRGEQLEYFFSGRCAAVAFFRVERQRDDVGVGHAVSLFALEEGVDEKREEVDEQQGLDAGDILEPHRCDVLDGLELLVAFFQLGLELVGLEDGFAGQGAVVADEGKHAVAALIGANAAHVDGGGDREARPDSAQVPCPGARSPALPLTIDGFVAGADRDLYPTFGTGRLQDAARFGLDGARQAQPAARSPQLLL